MDTSASAIAALEAQLIKAIVACDGDACSALLADDFTAIRPGTGGTLDINLRADWLKAISACEARTFTLDDTAVSVHGNFAVATILWSETTGISAAQFVVTDIWTRNGDTWALAERHAGATSVS
jgi:ketosteroid isomerase-like protein